MSWTDSFTRSSPTRPTRPSRSNYLPPHLRNNHHNTTPFPQNPNSADPDGFRVVPSRGGFRGRGRGRGGWSNSPRFQEDPIRTRDPKPFKVVDKFSNDVQVSEKEKEGESRGINFDAYEDIPVESTGSDIPPPAVSFAEIDMGPAVNANIRRCKYVRPTPVQRHAIPVALAGRDLMACAQTGSGKTAAFCFPIISGILKHNFAVGPAGVNSGGGGYCRDGASPVALILSPTRELSCQIYDEARKFSYQTGVKVAVAYGGAPVGLQLRNLEKGVDILVATPGRLVDMIERGKVSLKRIKFLALDEADRMLDMGFEQQIRKIVEQMEMPPPGARQTLLFSATFPTEIQRLAADFLSNYIFLSVGKVGSSTGLIDQKVELVQDRDKRGRLMSLLRDQRENGSNGERALTLVFVETKRSADGLENWLCQNRFPATAIHGDKVQMERERALRSFKSGSTPIMVATDVAARGLDVPNITHVINFDLPKNIDDYVHRIGRTGRAGKCGLATAFFNDKNSPIAKELVNIMQEAKQEVPSWLAEYAESLSTYGSGRANCYGGRKFGGHDFRSASFNENNSYANSYEGQDAFNKPYSNGSASYCSDPVDTGFSAASFDAYAGDVHVYDGFNGESGGWEGESSVGNGWGAESVVASGWE